MVVLASVALSSSGRRITVSRTKAPKVASKSVSLKILSKMLISFNPIFAPSRPRRLPKQHLHVGRQKSEYMRCGEMPLMRDEAIPIERRTDFGNIIGTTSFLTMMSGMLNIVAFLETECWLVGESTQFGSLAASIVGASSLLLVLSYVIGAALAGFFEFEGEALYLGKTSRGLCVSAVAIVWGAVLCHRSNAILPTLAMWSFAQGLQNAITTSASAFIGFPVRTTHMTASATDLGAGLGQWLKATLGGIPAPSLRKPMVCAMGLFSFVVGGLLGYFLHPICGVLAAFIPGVLLMILGFGRPGVKTPTARDTGDAMQTLSKGAVIDGIIQISDARRLLQ